MEDLEDRIRELGKILNSREYPPGSWGFAAYKVYTYPRKERRKALAELRSLRNGCIDENIRRIIDNGLSENREIRKEELSGCVYGGIGCLAPLIIASCIVFGMYSCIRDSNKTSGEKIENKYPAAELQYHENR